MGCKCFRQTRLKQEVRIQIVKGEKMKNVKMMLLCAGLVVTAAGLAGAHCDSMDGPVVIAAKAALESGNLDHVLVWVQPDDEAVTKEAFDKTMEVRKLGDKAAEIADTWFFETLVRVHRAGEGAPYTGLKPAGSTEEIIKKMDSSIEKGDIKELAEKIAGHIENSIKEKYAALLPLKKESDKSIEKGQAYVAGYVEFIHYVKNIKNTMHGAEQHGAAKAEKPAHD
jgi:hypothetical protein